MSDDNRSRVFRHCETCGKPFAALPWEIKRNRSRFCSRTCYYASRQVPLNDLFRRGIGDADASGCLLWQGATDHNGYGVVYSTARPPQRIFLAHRLAWEFANGPIPVGMCVLHNCPSGDNPLCVNVAHLYIGTQLDNIQDMARKGRHTNRKLTEDQVRVIRDRYAARQTSQQQLADEYQINQGAISAIILRKTYRYVD